MSTGTICRERPTSTQVVVWQGILPLTCPTNSGFSYDKIDWPGVQIKNLWDSGLMAWLGLTQLYRHQQLEGSALLVTPCWLCSRWFARTTCENTRKKRLYSTASVGVWRKVLSSDRFLFHIPQSYWRTLRWFSLLMNKIVPYVAPEFGHGEFLEDDVTAVLLISKNRRIFVCLLWLMPSYDCESIFCNKKSIFCHVVAWCSLVIPTRKRFSSSAPAF